MCSDIRPARPLRRDAQRNRDALLCAARGAFAEEGLNASLEGVARRAGVAIGTLYRHFPARSDLIEALFGTKLQAWIEAGEDALAMPDAWQGFAYYLERICELQAGDRGFNDLASMCLPLTACIDEARDRSYQLGREIITRAQRAGGVRPDVTAEDLAFLIWAHSRITDATHAIAPNAWRRHLGLMLDAFRADRATPLPVPPLRAEEVHQAMLKLGGDCG